MAGIEIFSDEQIERLCDVLAHPTTGLTGSEIGTYLLRLDIADPGPGMTRRMRLAEAFRTRQTKDKSGASVAAFVHATLAPGRYAGNLPLFEARRAEMNQALALCGYELSENGKLLPRAAVPTVSEIEQRAAALKAELERRAAHPDVVACCRTETLEQGSVASEAAKILGDKLRRLAGLASDGPELVEKTFGSSGGRLPLFAFNSMNSEREQQENSGLVLLLKGLFSALRSTSDQSEDLLDLLTAASLLHRRLDKAKRMRLVEGASVYDDPRIREPRRDGPA